MAKKIKIEFTKQQFMAVSQTVYHDVNDMIFEKEEGVPQRELRVLQNAQIAMSKGLKEWRKGK